MRPRHGLATGRKEDGMTSTTWQDALQRLLRRVDETGEHVTDGFPHYGIPPRVSGPPRPVGTGPAASGMVCAGSPPTTRERPATGTGPSSGPSDCAHALTPRPSFGVFSSTTAPSSAPCSWPIPWHAMLPYRGRRVWLPASIHGRASCRSALKPKKPPTSAAVSPASTASRAPHSWSGPRRNSATPPSVTCRCAMRTGTSVKFRVHGPFRRGGGDTAKTSRHSLSPIRALSHQQPFVRFPC